MVNTIQEENFIRSTTDPKTMAMLIQAKVIWKSTNRMVGIVPDTEWMSMPLRKRCFKLPINRFGLSPKAREYPQPTQTMLARQ